MRSLGATTYSLGTLLTLLALFAGQTTAETDGASSVCHTCQCSDKAPFIDCTGRNLTGLFSAQQWNATVTLPVTLNLTANLIRNLTAFPALPIRVLHLCDNRIERIVANAFRDLDDLEELDLADNRLTYQALRPDVFEGKYDAPAYEPLKKLKILNLANNRLHELDQDLFEHMPQLRELRLSGNPFRVIGPGANTAISRIPHLARLDLSDMELSALPEHIFHPPSELVHLNLAGNLLHDIPDALAFALHLQYLSLDENPLANLTGKNVFPVMPALQTLHLSYVPSMQRIGRAALSNLANLTALVCSHNAHLVEIDGRALSRPASGNATEQWPPIVELRLHNNNLRVLDAHLLARWDTLHAIEVHTNPWQCDCENQWLLDELLPVLAGQTHFDGAQLLCDEPPELLGEQLSVLSERHSKLRCLDGLGNRPERDGALLIGLLLGLLLGIPLALGSLVAFRRGCFGLRGRAGPGAAEYSRAFYQRAERNETDLRVHM